MASQVSDGGRRQDSWRRSLRAYRRLVAQGGGRCGERHANLPAKPALTVARPWRRRARPTPRA